MRVRDLPSILNLEDDDLFYCVDFSAGPAGGRKITLGDLRSLLSDLQSVYTNSTDGRIVTDATRGALKVEEGTIVGGNLYEGYNDAGVLQFSIDVNGNISLAGTVDGRDVAADGTQTDLNTTHRNTTTGNPHNVTATDVGLGNVTNEAQIPLSQKGAPNGVAELDGSGVVPTSQLPPGGGVITVNGDPGPAVILDSDDITQGATNNYTNTPEGQTDITNNVTVAANSAHLSNFVNPHRAPLIATFTDRDFDYIEIDNTGTFVRMANIPWPGTNVVGVPTSITLDYTYRDNDAGFFCTVELRDSGTGLVIANAALPQPPNPSEMVVGFDLGTLSNLSANRGLIELYGQRNQGADFGRLGGIMISF